MRPIDLIPQYSPRRHLMLFSGDPGVGKSRLAMQCAQALATGQGIFWPDQEPLKVLLAAERTKEVIDIQLHDLQIVPTENFIIMSREVWDSQQISPLQMVALECRKQKPDLVILDTVASFWPLEVGKSVADYQAMVRACGRLQGFATEHQCALWMVHHAAKEREGSRYTKTWQKSLGSQAIMGSVLAAWFLSEEAAHETTRWLRLEVLSHISLPLASLYLRCDPDQPYKVVSQDDLPASAKSEASGKIEDAVLNALGAAGGVQKAKLVSVIGSALHVDPKNVYRAIRRLKEKRLIYEKVDEDENILVFPTKTQ